MREIRPSGSMRGRRGYGVAVAANQPRLPTLLDAKDRPEELAIGCAAGERLVFGGGASF